MQFVSMYFHIFSSDYYPMTKCLLMGVQNILMFWSIVLRPSKSWYYLRALIRYSTIPNTREYTNSVVSLGRDCEAALQLPRSGNLVCFAPSIFCPTKLWLMLIFVCTPLQVIPSLSMPFRMKLWLHFLWRLIG